MAADVSDAPIRVLVADDQTVVREGLEMLLGLSPGIQVVGAAGKDDVSAIGADLRQPVRRHLEVAGAVACQ